MCVAGEFAEVDYEVVDHVKVDLGLLHFYSLNFSSSFGVFQKLWSSSFLALELSICCYLRFFAIFRMFFLYLLLLVLFMPFLRCGL